MITERGRPGRPAVLVVDDEPQILKSLGDLLRRDFRVFATDDGNEALDLLGRHDIAVLLTDQRMPGMTGADLLGQAVNSSPDTVRILLTGYSDIEAVIRAVNEGRVFQYVAKPWDPGELLALVTGAARYHALVVEQRRLLQRLDVAERDRAAQEQAAGALADRATRLERENRWLERTVDQLRRSSDVLGRIGEVLPICLECGKVKNREAVWQDVARYLAESGLPLSHGYCPTCARVVAARHGLGPLPE